MIDMQRKYVTLAAAALVLSGCSTSQVVPAGKDSYVVSATRCGTCAPAQAAVLQQANSSCAAQGKYMQISNMDGGTHFGGFPSNATLLFSCLNESDPEYQRPTLRKDNGVNTIEIR